jgi:hypothetical protein
LWHGLLYNGATVGGTIMKESLLKGLSPDQIEKVKACEDTHDLLQLAKDEGVELNEEQLSAVSGGACSSEEKTDKKEDGHRKYES